MAHSHELDGLLRGRARPFRETPNHLRRRLGHSEPWVCPAQRLKPSASPAARAAARIWLVAWCMCG